ncbi:FAD-dependent monooxygenase [Kitasatospora cineracea]|uniref:2-polyprenyl-6-methoxyphenol hydroxylase-like FAD-dependent oxidoreductase n=1 Tax=Kitasatospora cineracea TaxID=88074 RepID=A0A3N4RLJ2_9ACTN|nr:FAD-dependent monooxygenase [Kitasatospora cineracea]RPE29297.1 2-polyprenyl-6-methoxyphenol hydroxylase-like FAD-dependent oxidoreductase [Kitasatospora cineracea]
MHEETVDVLVVGAGPVGLTAAAELRRHGVHCRILDRVTEPPPYPKAVGVQPRTFEVWEAMGLVGRALDAALPLHGQLTFTDRAPGPRTALDLPADVPYRFAALPQYTTERLLAEHLAGLGTEVERGVALTGLRQDEDHVRAVLDDGRTLAARYVVGCDGAHSTVRKAAGIAFDGDAFPEQYMLGDVELDWDLPPGHVVRATGADPGDVLVAVPLPGHRRYRISSRTTAPDGAAPGLPHLQAVLDRLAPGPVTAHALRWSSTFRISHRLAARYRAGRVLLAGDAAHIHPPTGAQGMNTGIQDAHNLAWKLALTVHGLAADTLLDSYHAERRPVGEEVVGRTVRHARSTPGDLTANLLREAQLLIAYPDSPVTDPSCDGSRAPDCTGLQRPLTGYPARLHELLHGPRPVLLLHAGPRTRAADLNAAADAARAAAHDRLDVHVILAADAAARPDDLRAPWLGDPRGAFRRAYAPRDGEALLVRPDTHLAARLPTPAPAPLTTALRRLFAPR